jgi:hypothetical protein
MGTSTTLQQTCFQSSERHCEWAFKMPFGLGIACSLVLPKDYVCKQLPHEHDVASGGESRSA